MASPSEVLPLEPPMSFLGGRLTRVSQFTDLGEPGFLPTAFPAPLPSLILCYVFLL